MAPHTPNTQALTTSPATTNPWSYAPQHPDQRAHPRPDDPTRPEHHSLLTGRNPIGGFRLKQEDHRAIVLGQHGPTPALRGGQH